MRKITLNSLLVYGIAQLLLAFNELGDIANVKHVAVLVVLLGGL